VTLVVTTAPTPVIRTAVNAASFVAGPVSPGVILTITGTDLGPATGVGAPSGTTIPTTLGGVQVRFDGIAAPILYASATQLNVVVPFEVAGRQTTKIQVESQNVRSTELELTVRDATPGIFTQNSSGNGAGAIVNQNGTVNTPSNPEAAGNVIVIYATGFGQLVPAPASGSVVPGTGAIPRPVLPVRVKIGGVETEVLYAGAAPGFVAGAIQVNARIPAGTQTGSPPVQVQVGDQVSPGFVTVSVR
jgi:uncharacterized protein (TIGR03437 family)